MTNMAARSPVKPLFYVMIDGTRAIDSVTIGSLWQQFGWKNLLDGMTIPASDANRRTDAAHPSLPIRFMQEARPGKASTMFSDVVIMPEGRDGEGVDKGNWSSASKTGNAVQMNAANGFIQTFILAPNCDPIASKLGGGPRHADLVYVSSHGVLTGDMFGEASNEIDKVDPFFILAKAAASGAKFLGVKWLILSNCNTLVDPTHNDWLTLMGASPGFRGILGYHGTSVAADESAGVNVTFVNRLKKPGTSLRDAWRQANKAFGASMTGRWVIMCHDAARDDTIDQWNRGTLAGIPMAPPVIKLFDEANPAGIVVTRRADPFGVTWSALTAGAATTITAANRYDAAHKIGIGDNLRITVRSAPSAAAFAAGTVIEVTLIFVREDYPEPIDLDRMFTITASAGIAASVQRVRHNIKRADKGNDTWVMTVTGTQAAVSLDLHIDKLFIGAVHHNLPYWLRAGFTPPGGAAVPVFDFIHDAAIYVS
jgi:hypothetical protein